MDKVLFCPFCGEAFEGETRCPEHELELLPWAELPKPERVRPDQEALPWYSPSLGRGWVACSAGATLLAFVLLPLARVDGSLRMGGSMLSLALHGTPRLWLIPAAAIAELLILRRRRSPAAMRGARLALLCVGLVAPVAIAWAWFSVTQAFALLASRMPGALRLHFGAGAVLILLAALPLLVGVLRLGIAAGDQGTSDTGR